MALSAIEQMQAALDNKHLQWSVEVQMRVAMWALVSMAESLKAVADSLPWEVKRVGDVVVGRTKEA